MTTPLKTRAVLVVSRDGRKTVRTTVMLGGPENHELRIETSKMYDRAGIETDATVVVLTDHGFSHAFALSGRPLDGDFRCAMLADEGVRATAKALGEQHARALPHVEDVLARARGHYVAKEMRKEMAPGPERSAAIRKERGLPPAIVG